MGTWKVQFLKEIQVSQEETQLQEQGRLKGVNKCFCIRDGFVDFLLSHRPEERWSLTNKMVHGSHQNLLANDLCWQPQVWNSGCYQHRALRGIRLQWQEGVSPGCPCFLSRRAWRDVRNEGWSWVTCMSNICRTGPDPLPTESNRHLASPSTGTRICASKEGKLIRLFLWPAQGGRIF